MLKSGLPITREGKGQSFKNLDVLHLVNFGPFHAMRMTITITMKMTKTMIMKMSITMTMTMTMTMAMTMKIKM